MNSRIAPWLLAALCVSALPACVASSEGEDEIAADVETVGQVSQAVESVDAPAFVLEIRGGCGTQADIARFLNIVGYAAAVALRSADIARNGNGPASTVFDWHKSFPTDGSAPEYPYTNYYCDAGANAVSQFGAWLGPATSPGRFAALREQSLLSAGENIAFRATNSGITKLIGFGFQDVNKSMNASGQYDPNGDIKLSSVSAKYPSSTAAMVDVRGSYDGVFSVTGFNARVTDTLTITPAKWVSCKSTMDVKADASIDSVLNAVFNISGDLGNRLGQFLSRGPLCQAVSALQQDYLLPGTNKKMQMQVEGVRMAAGVGVTFGGEFMPLTRVPTIAILGDLSQTLEPGDDVEPMYFRTVNDDLRAPITYKWTSTGGTFSSQTANTYGSWSIGSGPTTYKTVTVKATDADGVTATTTRTVTFHRVSRPIGGD